jgi:hypothetical protein
MFCYRLVGFSYESSDTVALIHARHFTEAEFQALVVEATPKAFEAFIHSRDILFNNPETLERLHDHLVTILTTQYGFRHVVYAAEFYYMNWRHLDNDGFQREGDNCELMVEALAQRGYTQDLVKAWDYPLESLPDGDNPPFLEGFRAGLAFKINEAFGSRLIRKLARYDETAD